MILRPWTNPFFVSTTSVLKLNYIQFNFWRRNLTTRHINLSAGEINWISNNWQVWVWVPVQSVICRGPMRQVLANEWSVKFSALGVSLWSPGLVKICLLRPNLARFLHCTFYTILGLISLKVYIFTNKINNRKVNSLIRTDRAQERKLPELIVVNFLQRNSFHEI